jgi:hypothetical protein
MRRSLLAAVVAISVATPAFGQFGLAPGVGAGKVLSAQFGIQGPTTTVCPTQARATGWVFTNYLGNVTIMIARRGQAVGAPITIKTVPAANGQYMATYTQTIPITAPIDAEYRLLVGGGSGITSNWVRLRASCQIGAGPGNLFGG